MKLLVRSSLVLLCMLAMFAACATQMKSYVSARTVLNNYWESYLDVRDLMPEGDEKVAFRAKFKDTGKTSYFTEAAESLDIWNEVIGSDDVAAKKAYYKILNKIISLLVLEGVIQVE